MSNYYHLLLFTVHQGGCLKCTCTTLTYSRSVIIRVLRSELNQCKITSNLEGGVDDPAFLTVNENEQDNFDEGEDETGQHPNVHQFDVGCTWQYCAKIHEP